MSRARAAASSSTRSEHQRQARELFESLHLDLDPRVKVADLTVAKQQMVEIAKAVSFNSRSADHGRADGRADR